MPKIEDIKWNLWKKKATLLTLQGFLTGKVHRYEKELIENLRGVYYGGIPASILLLCKSLCTRYCDDRALLIVFGFGEDDFKIINAQVQGIKLNPENIGEYKGEINHCFAERTKKDGSVWVYDTTAQLVYEKSLYYKMQRPKIRKINDKQATLDYIEYQEIKNADIERDKYAVPLILPNIEFVANNKNEMYQSELKEEIERFKKEIDYDRICKEKKEMSNILLSRK